MKKLFLFVVFLLFVVSLDGENEKISSYIDIPSATPFPPGFYLNFSGSYALGEDPYSVDLNGIISLIVNNMEFDLTGFQIGDWALDFKYTFLVKKKYSLALGIDRITYQEYITPVGSGESRGYTDERYITRPSEWFSAYLVSTINMGPFFEATIGVGRGRFVGYGPRSRYFNTDYLFNREGVIPTSGTHPDYALGLFGGLRIKFTPLSSFVVEEDGRDVNAGFIIGNDNFNAHLTLTKIEQFTDLPDANVRVDISFGAKAVPFRQVKKGLIVFRIYDQKDKSPLPATVTLYTKDGKVFQKIMVPRDGFLEKEVPVGTYKISISSQGYKSKAGRLNLREGKKINLKIGLIKKLTPEEVAVISALKRARKKIKNGDLLGARGEVLNALKILPSSPDAIAMESELNSLIEKKVAELRQRAISLEKSNPASAINVWQEILRYKPGNKEIVSRIESLNNRLKLAAAQKRKPAPRKKAVTKTNVKEKTTPKPSKATLTKWYKKAVGYYLEGKYKESYNLLRKILKYDPNNNKVKKYLKKVKAKL